jgi:hypothetical protein
MHLRYFNFDGKVALNVNMTADELKVMWKEAVMAYSGPDRDMWAPRTGSPSNWHSLNICSTFIWFGGRKTDCVLIFTFGQFCKESRVETWVKWHHISRDRRLYFPRKDVVLRGFIALNNPSSSAEFEPANLRPSSKSPDHSRRLQQH